MNKIELTLEEVGCVVTVYDILINKLHSLIDKDITNLGLYKGESYTVESVCPESDEVGLLTFGCCRGEYYEEDKNIRLSSLLEGKVELL